MGPDGRQPYNSRNFYGEHSVFSGNFDPNSTLQYGIGSFGYTNYSTAFKFAEGDQAGGGNTYYGQEAFKILQNLLNPQANFSQFDFTKFRLNSDGPGNPIRKYLKKKSKSYFGAIESIDQYQLDHANWTDEYQGTMEFLGELKDYFDSAGDNLGGAGYGSFALDNLKTIKDIVDKFKDFSPSLGAMAGAIVGTIGTSIKMEGDRFGQIMDIYKNADYRYDQLHKRNPMLDKGVTVNINVVIGTNGGGYTNISIYDISTHRYLSGGRIVHRN